MPTSHCKNVPAQQEQEIFMPTEIERKFLVKNESWRALADGVLYRQGYLSVDPERTVRVRTAGERGYVTIKGKTSGISRSEFEYEIPLADATQLLDTLCLQPLIEKRRHRIQHGALLWEVDDFLGVNQGLVVAEVELQDPAQSIDLPEWVGQEVSNDPRYFNANLVARPYSRWR
jgi:CYTH domain-containing protein